MRAPPRVFEAIKNMLDAGGTESVTVKFKAALINILMFREEKLPSLLVFLLIISRSPSLESSFLMKF